MTVVELRPLSLGELLDRTFSLYRNHFWLFVGIGAMPQLILLGPALLTDAMASFTADDPMVVGLVMLAVSLVWVLGWLLAYGFTQVATAFAVSEVHLGRATTIRESYSRAYAGIGRVLLVVILVFVGIVVGLFPVAIPAIWFFLRSCLSVMPAVLEDKPPVEAIRRGMQLTKGNLGRVALMLALFSLIGWVASIIFQWLPFVITASIVPNQPEASSNWALIFILAGKLAADVLTGPLLSIGFALLYFDLRVRKEGFDLKVMLEQLQPTPQQAAG